ncbi:MAG: hemin uptake protein HemP [Pseudomonadota bacterium]
MTRQDRIEVPARRTSPEEDIPAYDARDIVRNGVQARLILDQKTYVLRITRAGKLILTK